MNNLICYKRLPIWNAQTLPKLFFEKHNTKVGTWAKLNIIQGSLDFDILTEQGGVIKQYQFDADNQPPFIEPQQWHRIAKISDDIECQLLFFCLAKDYTQKKYDMNPTHSEVVAASQIVTAGKALDLGCGSGRNSFYLHLLGFDVDAVDNSQLQIERIKKIIQDEQLRKISSTFYDINQANWDGEYDFIISTVVLMFLQPDTIPNIINNMQSITKIGGYNLIVSAMTTEDYPCPVDFSFTFREGELKNYYSNWDIIKYNENIGELHKTDLAGNRIKLRFATLLAKKK